METIATTEIRHLMDTAVNYARYCKANGMDQLAKDHARTAMAYATELDLRAAA